MKKGAQGLGMLINYVRDVQVQWRIQREAHGARAPPLHVLLKFSNCSLRLHCILTSNPFNYLAASYLPILCRSYLYANEQCLVVFL